MRHLFIIISLLLAQTAIAQRSPRVVDSISALVAIPSSTLSPDAIVQGIGGGQFKWDATSTEATNSADVIAKPYGAAIGRWIRQPGIAGTVRLGSAGLTISDAGAGSMTINVPLVVDGGLTNDVDFDDIARLTLDSTDASLTGVSTAYLDGGITTIRGITNLQIITPAVFAGSATTGQYLRLSDAIEGGVEFADAASSMIRSRASSALFFGDSVAAGAAASSVANTWWSQVATYYGWSPTNLAFGGAVATDLTWQSQPGYSYTNGLTLTRQDTPSITGTNLNVFGSVGLNDAGDFPTSSGVHSQYLTNYYNSHLYFATYWSTPAKVLATAATQTGTWTDWANQFGVTVGEQSTVSGSTLVFETMGDAVYIAFPVGLTNSSPFGKFWVSINGTAVELVDPNNVAFGNRNQYLGSTVSYIPHAATNSFWARRYSGYGQRRQTVTITATNNASVPTVVLWVAGSQQPYGPTSGPNVWLMENINRAADAARDATYSNLRGQLNSLVQTLARDGLQVAILRPNQDYNSANTADGIHPNNAGMVEVARSVRRGVDLFEGLALGVPTSTNSVSAPVDVASTSAGIPSFRATTSGTAFGYEAVGTSFSYIAKSASGTPSLFFNKSAGTDASPTAVLNNTLIGGLFFAPYDGSAYVSGVQIDAYATQNHGTTNHGQAVRILTVPNNSTTPALAAIFGQDKTFTAYGPLISVGQITAQSGVAVTGAISGNTSGTGLSLDGDGQFGVLATRISDSSYKEIAILRARAGTTAVQANDVIGGFAFYPRNDTTYPGSRASFRAVATETHSGSAQGTRAVISATATGSTTQTDVVSVTGAGVSIAGTTTLGATGTSITRLRHGVATLVGGSATVSDVSVTSSSRIILTSQADGGTPGWLRVSIRTASTSFTITSSSGTDTSTVAWMMIEP